VQLRTPTDIPATPPQIIANARLYGTIDDQFRLLLFTARSPMKLLLVEDNPILSHWLAKVLEQEDFALDTALDGITADQLLRTNYYDVVLLDLNLPKLSGKNVLRGLRLRDDTTPVMILTASGSIDDKVELLGAGADDYLVKPVEFRELIARIKVLIRWQTASTVGKLICGDLKFNIDSRQFTLNSAPLHLTPREHNVLERLILCPGKTVSKVALMDSLFTLADEATEEAVEVYISRVRKKLDGSSAAIVTLRGLGYVLRPIESN